MTFFVPKKNTSLYNMYVYSFIESKEYDKQKEGTFFKTKGVAVIFYKYQGNFRCCYIITEATEEDKGKKIPGVLEPVKVLAYVRGREIDVLKNAMFKLRKYNKIIYTELPVVFWMNLFFRIGEVKKKRTFFTDEQLSAWIKQYQNYQVFQDFNMEEISMEAENDISMNNAMLVFDVSSKNKNISIREIAEQTGLHRNTVRKYLPSRPSNEDLVTKLMIENPDITINEIQEKLNLSYKTVKKYYDDWKAIWNGDIFVNY